MLILFPMSQRKLFATIAILVGYTSAALAGTDYVFTGRWRMDTASIKGDIKSSDFLLMNGEFKRDDNEAVKADGRLYPVLGSGYVDQKSISIESDYSVKEVDKIRGKIVYTVHYSISSDGNTLTWYVSSFTNPNGQEVKSVTIQRRVGSVIKGAHLISGKWERVSMNVDAKSDWLLKLDGGNFSWRKPAGTGYDAIVGGDAVSIDGDSADTRALITRPRLDTIVETDISKEGERQTSLSMQILSNNNTISCVAYNFRSKRTTIFVLHRVSE